MIEGILFSCGFHKVLEFRRSGFKPSLEINHFSFNIVSEIPSLTIKLWSNTWQQNCRKITVFLWSIFLQCTWCTFFTLKCLQQSKFSNECNFWKCVFYRILSLKRQPIFFLIFMAKWMVLKDRKNLCLMAIYPMMTKTKICSKMMVTLQRTICY